MSLFAPVSRDWHLPASFRLFTWMEPDSIGACIYPQTDLELAEIAGLGVTLLINLHERPHPESALTRHSLEQLHLPVPDMSPPTLDQIELGLSALASALDRGQKVVVHCAAGLGRTGTLLACHYVRQGMSAEQAVAHVRELRPGSVESHEQERTVASFARLTGERAGS